MREEVSIECEASVTEDPPITNSVEHNSRLFVYGPMPPINTGGRIVETSVRYASNRQQSERTTAVFPENDSEELQISDVEHVASCLHCVDILKTEEVHLRPLLLLSQWCLRKLIDNDTISRSLVFK